MPSDARLVGVFCAAAAGADPAYRHAALNLGRHIAARGLTLVYGGGGAGLMGAVADGALAEGGTVIGVIPGFMVEAEHAHKAVADMRIVSSMADRKEMIIALADVFIALPGGVGTLDEMFEVISLAQLKFHRKRLAILDVDDFYASLIEFLERASNLGFIRDPDFAVPTVHRRPADALDHLLGANTPADS